jgi:hypothetical protein
MSRPHETDVGAFFRGGEMGGRGDGKGVVGSAKVAYTVTWPKVTTDYHGALLRLATMRATKKQYLIFGYVELFPRDIPLPESFTAGDKPWTVPGSSGEVTLAASAGAMPVADALAWYENAARGRVTIPRNGNPIELIAPPFGVEPALGRFCVGETVLSLLKNPFGH